ncbi:MAG: lysophospholipid acyltransferase family protein [Thermodesulfobacteriota bacterium]|nr:lysophospholipid acyltransferase family protein [Thermodesulfobacteriota bacterium]
MTIVEKIVYHGISGFMSLLGRLSPSTGSAFGNMLGSLWFAFDKKHRKLCIDNLTKAFAPEKSSREIRILARNVFNNTATMVFEHARFHRAGPDNFPRFVKFYGIDNLKNAHGKGRGVICFSGHLGNWELACSTPFITGLPFAVVYKPIEFLPFDRYITDKRESTGCTTFPMHNALEGIRMSLGRGELVGLIIDQNARKRHQSIFVDFMGRKASAGTGPAKLALSTKAPVVPMFIFRENGGFKLEILPEIPLIRTGDEESDIKANTQIFHSMIEKYVRKYPDQWFWIHNRWRTRPLEEKNKL